MPSGASWGGASPYLVPGECSPGDDFGTVCVIWDVNFPTLVTFPWWCVMGEMGVVCGVSVAFDAFLF